MESDDPFFQKRQEPEELSRIDQFRFHSKGSRLNNNKNQRKQNLRERNPKEQKKRNENERGPGRQNPSPQMPAKGNLYITKQKRESQQRPKHLIRSDEKRRKHHKRE